MSLVTSIIPSINDLSLTTYPHLDSQDYSVQTALDDWLDGLGPVVIPEAVAGREKRYPREGYKEK